MTEPPNSEPGDNTHSQSRPGPTAMPRWVKVFLIIAILLVLVFILSQLLGVQHGPGLHSLPGDAGGPSAPVQAAVDPT